MTFYQMSYHLTSPKSCWDRIETQLDQIEGFPFSFRSSRNQEGEKFTQKNSTIFQGISHLENRSVRFRLQSCFVLRISDGAFFRRLG